MGRLDEIFSEQFASWVERGQGWKVWPYAVTPEPPFRPFAGYRLPQPDVEEDDGRKPGLLASLFESIEQVLNSKPPVLPEPPEVEPDAEPLERDELVELQMLLPADLDTKPEVFADFLSQLSVCREPVAFEILALQNQIAVQFAGHPHDMAVLKRHLTGYFPEIACLPVESALVNAWVESRDETLIVELGLEREFLFPLSTERKLDPFIGLMGAMRELQTGELALFQVLFQATDHAWRESAKRAVTDAQDKPIFVNRPELAEAAESKLSTPLQAAVVRVAVKAAAFHRTVDIARQLAFSLRVYASQDGNSLIPLSNDEYRFSDHEEDVLLRQTHRTGMLLNAEELTGFVHFPSSAVRAPELLRQSERTQAAPESVMGNSGYILGQNPHLGRTVSVGLNQEQRTKHVHAIGVPGTGKSNFMLNLIQQDLENGEGLAVLDPHGDLIEKILGRIPKERIGDVILLDPADEEYSVPFNILSAHSELEKRLIASDLTAIFQRLSTSWGDQMTSVLNNAILAFLESSEGGTLADMRRFLIDAAYRTKFLTTVSDPNVVFYWQKAFSQLVGNRSIGPLLTRLDALLSRKPLYRMVSQKENRLDFSAMMNEGKIFLAKLSQGSMGFENSYLMGSLLMAKFHLAAIGRQSIPESARRFFGIYLDEAHNFATPSMVEILTGARKYRVGLVLAHQELSQLERVKEIAGAIMGCNTRVVFRVVDSDARKLSEGFAHFEAGDFQNLETGEAICKVERADHDFNLTLPFSGETDKDIAAARRHEVIARSRVKYGTPREEIEAIQAKTGATPLTNEPPLTPPPSGLVKPKPPIAPAPSFIPSPSPEIAEPPKPTLAKVPQAEMPPPLSEILKPGPVPVVQTYEPRREPCQGRGGPEHQIIQRRIKSEAEKLGFRSTIEMPVLASQASIDVWLERSSIVIACEISFTNTEDNESSKIIKCLKAGIPKFAMICADVKKLQRIAAAISNNAEAELASRVEYFQPDSFIEYIKALPVEPPKESERIRRGYKVKHSQSAGSTEERQAKEEAAIRAIAESMQQKKKK